MYCIGYYPAKESRFQTWLDGLGTKVRSTVSLLKVHALVSGFSDGHSRDWALMGSLWGSTMSVCFVSFFSQTGRFSWFLPWERHKGSVSMSSEGILSVIGSSCPEPSSHQWRNVLSRKTDGIQNCVVWFFFLNPNLTPNATILYLSILKTKLGHNKISLNNILF